MCLTCSGTHRGLGVHVSFIRSVSMDGFKVGEVSRMSLGGNDPWKTFYDTHPDNQLEGRSFEDATVKERYDSLVGEEYKERLTAKVEGRAFDKPAWEKQRADELAARQASRNATPSSLRSQSPAAAATASVVGGGGGGGRGVPPGQKAQNEAYFARMGAANAGRRDDVPPNQGGKYAGFGSDPGAMSGGGSAGGAGAGAPEWLNDFQKDPMAGLTKGFGWLGKSAQTGYNGWLKPNMQKVCFPTCHAS